jgi:hypothetical protein
VATRSKAWICGRSLAGISSNPAGTWMCVVGVVCCQIEVSATSRSFVQRSPTERGVSECDRGFPRRRPRPTRAVEPLGPGGGDLRRFLSKLQTKKEMNFFLLLCLYSCISLLLLPPPPRIMRLDSRKVSVYKTRYTCWDCRLYAVTPLTAVCFGDYV